MIVSNDLFRVKEYPEYNPITEKYKRIGWYKEQKRRCIEGYWHSGKWISGPLYYYINFHHIWIEDETGIAQRVSLPFLRDIDWELFFYYEECRGFSGFDEDLEYTCDRNYGPDRDLAVRLGRISLEQSESKIYMPSREYLRMWHGTPKGKPLYANSAKNMLSIQARGGGKSYASSGIAAHNFLFDGAIDYDDYLSQKREKTPYTSDTIIGAIDTKYTQPLLRMVLTGFDHLPGSVEYMGVPYASPLQVSHTGSLAPNKEWRSKNGSLLRHRTFKDNPLAANGTRPNLVVLDEIGFMTNIREAWGAIMATQSSKQYQRLVIWALGTGGYISGKSAVYAESVFRNPEQFNCISYDDIFDNTHKKIGYFVPYELTLNEFKMGENKITDLNKSREYIEHRRETAKESTDTSVYITEIINGPQKPSEAFLVVEGGYFPAFQLKEQYQFLMQHPDRLSHTFKGSLKIINGGKLEWVNDTTLEPIRNFPLLGDEDREGCVEIYQKPQIDPTMNRIPPMRYIIGADTVDKARATTTSLFSCFVFDRWTRKIVAEYTGRTDDPTEAYEKCRRLAMYYNAKIMYEQTLPGIFTYFEQQRSTFLLADTPTQLRNKATYKIGSNTSKGIPTSETLNRSGREFVLSWLKEQLDVENPSYTPIKTIESPALLRELITWNKDGNYDRVSALSALFWLDNTMYKSHADHTEANKSRAQHPYYVKMGLVKKSITNQGAQDPRIADIIARADQAEEAAKEFHKRNK
ncbi:MAG TPA: hypothetical protein DCY51_11265 [Bacteroidetes bacterium]|nr:hypothetical protein [Bacteroidota bacterium]